MLEEEACAATLLDETEAATDAETELTADELATDELATTELDVLLAPAGAPCAPPSLPPPQAARIPTHSEADSPIARCFFNGNSRFFMIWVAILFWFLQKTKNILRRLHQKTTAIRRWPCHLAYCAGLGPRR